jgi:hypothetical protein
MLLYCRNDLVFAIHRDDQVIGPKAYGGGVRVIPAPDGTKLDVANPSDPHVQIYKAPAPTNALLLAYAANKRWLTATGGAVVDRIPVATDDASQARIAQLKQAFDSLALATTTFKTADGKFVTVDGAQMTAIHAGVVAHVQACYAAEARAVAAINTGTISTWDAVDAQFAAII